ncbi:unnamed protein product [Ostreobium quekettii]|uniref:Thioesterase domain-containing protein n=1 Tax=Ostreobium quekettii TaxID=121088 RepID=A0A8S1J4Y6_9CHLO|nr:unnamed protein product [Ostreobium quekettii]|eukprot:evm.model.scf_475.2 EVM.evm.TU.scf_475.2   scf_475:28852-32902(-)
MIAGGQRSGRLVRLLARAHSAQAAVASESKWRWLDSTGHDINPCNSRLHPAVVAGIEPRGEAISVQEAYTPMSKCFGCGPANRNGLQLKSTRTERGLEGNLSIPDKFLAFPGVINGGVVSSILECHGNWTAALELMDKACLPRPPLTLTASMFVNYKRPTPSNEPLLVRSQIVRIIDTGTIGLTKQAVEVDLQLFCLSSGREELLVTAEGLFKRQGATCAL